MNGIKVLPLLLLLVLAAPAAHAQDDTTSVALDSVVAPHPATYSRTRFIHWAWSDAASLVTTPIQRAPARTTGSIILLGALSLADRAINDEVNEGYHGLFADYVNEANRLGGPTVKYPALGIFAVSLLTRDTRFQDAAYTSLEAVVYANALNYAVKFAAGRERPEDSKSQYRFHPFSGNSSFPSGHACTAFALLTPWALYYRHPVTYGLLVAGAGGTALSRVARGKHWASDVTAGGTLGFLTALWLTERHQYAARQTAEQTGMKASLTPVTGPEGSGLRFTMQW